MTTAVERALQDAHSATHAFEVDDGDAEVYVLPDARFAHAAMTVVPEGGTYDAEITVAAPLADTSMMTGWVHVAEGDGQAEGRAWALSPAVTAVRVTASGGDCAVHLAFRT